jgi:hypothetical protein
MPLITFLIILGLVVAACWLINKYITGTWRTILLVVVVGAFVLWLLNLLGLLNGFNGVTIGHSRHVGTVLWQGVKSLWA